MDECLCETHQLIRRIEEMQAWTRKHLPWSIP